MAVDTVLNALNTLIGKVKTGELNYTRADYKLLLLLLEDLRDAKADDEIDDFRDIIKEATLDNADIAGDAVDFLLSTLGLDTEEELVKLLSK